MQFIFELDGDSFVADGQYVTLRERPFTLKGRGGVMFFFKKIILIPNVAKKNILILVEEKKII
jgi:hypothetical protein